MTLFARMEDINHLFQQTIQDIHTIANTYTRMLDFSDFCTNVHDANNCKESDCGFKNFLIFVLVFEKV